MWLDCPWKCCLLLRVSQRPGLTPPAVAADFVDFGVEEIRPMLTCHHEVYQRLPGILISLPGYVPCKAPPLFAFNGLPLLPCSSCSVVLIFETTLMQLFVGLGRHCLNSVAHQLMNIWSSPDMSACEYEDKRPYCRVAPMGSHSGHLCESFHHLRPP